MDGIKKHIHIFSSGECLRLGVGYISVLVFHSVIPFAITAAPAVVVAAVAALRFRWRLTGSLCVFYIHVSFDFSALFLLWFTEFNVLILRYICGRLHLIFFYCLYTCLAVF